MKNNKDKQEFCPTCGMPVKVIGGHPDFIGDTQEGCTMHYEPDLPDIKELTYIISKAPHNKPLLNRDYAIAQAILKRIEERK